MTEQELKPCPFCGSEPCYDALDYDALDEDHEDGAAEMYYYVVCQTCGAETDGYRTAEDAASKWNQRVDADRDRLAVENARLRWALWEMLGHYAPDPDDDTEAAVTGRPRR